MKQIFIILGRPASKKNSKQVFWKNGKYNVISSEAFTNFERSALQQLKIYPSKNHDLPLRVTYEFHQKGKLTQDIDNAQASINDVLQKGGFIKDDKWIKEVHAYCVSDSDWKSIITLETLV